MGGCFELRLIAPTLGSGTASSCKMRAPTSQRFRDAACSTAPRARVLDVSPCRFGRRSNEDAVPRKRRRFGVLHNAFFDAAVFLDSMRFLRRLLHAAEYKLSVDRSRRLLHYARARPRTQASSLRRLHKISLKHCSELSRLSPAALAARCESEACREQHEEGSRRDFREASSKEEATKPRQRTKKETPSRNRVGDQRRRSGIGSFVPRHLKPQCLSTWNQ